METIYGETVKILPNYENDEPVHYAQPSISTINNMIKRNIVEVENF